MPVRVPANLSATTLNQIADHLEDLAKSYRQSAKRAEENERAIAHGRQELARAIATPQLVDALLKAGMPLEPAQQAVATHTDFPIETIIANWRYHQRSQRGARTVNREREVKRLARRGHSNRDIAQQLGIHLTSVSRILTRKLRQDRPATLTSGTKNDPPS